MVQPLAQEVSIRDEVRPKWVLVNGKLRDVSEFAHVQPRVRPVTTCSGPPTECDFEVRQCAHSRRLLEELSILINKLALH